MKINQISLLSRNWIVAVGLVSLMAIVIGGAAAFNALNETDEPEIQEFKIGLITPLTGASATEESSMVNAATMAVQAFNQAGSVVSVASTVTTTSTAQITGCFSNCAG